MTNDCIIGECMSKQMFFPCFLLPSSTLFFLPSLGDHAQPHTSSLPVFHCQVSSAVVSPIYKESHWDLGLPPQENALCSLFTPSSPVLFLFTFLFTPLFMLIRSQELPQSKVSRLMGQVSGLFQGGEAASSPGGKQGV